MAIVSWYGNWYDISEPTLPATPEPPTTLPTSAADPRLDPLREPQSRLGLVLGRFDPPHRGHEFLLRFARQSCPRLAVGVNSTAQDLFPARQRVGWLRELVPGVRVEAFSGLGSDMAEVAARVVRRLGPIGYLFSSQPEAAELAVHLGARFCCLDSERRSVPVSSRLIRSRPFAHWDYLPDGVRAAMALRVAVVGAHGTGKTTLAEELARHYRTPWVQEQARRVSEPRLGKLRPTDFEPLGKAQAAAEEALARQANRVLICDTDLGTLAYWSQRLHGSCPEALLRQARERHYDLHLLQGPWPGAHPTNVEIHAEMEAHFTGRICRLQGTQAERLGLAIDAVETLLMEPLPPIPPPAAPGPG